MKRLFKFLILIVGCFLLYGCSYDSQILDNSKYTVVCTNFAGYDWTMSVIGDKKNLFDVKLITDSGTDIHSYQPSTFDIAIIKDCDILVCTGGESEGWVLEAAKGEDDKIVNMMQILSEVIREEELVEGMEGEEPEEEEGIEEEAEYDEHVWLSLRNAQIVSEAISEKLCELDVNDSTYFEKNAEDYISSLAQIDNEYEKIISSASGDTLVFGDRFPFRYLVDDYDINYYAAFVGCSTESDAAFDTIVFLTEKIKELGINDVMTIEKSDCSVAKIVANVTSDKELKILGLDSMQSVTRKQIEEGYTYIGAMKSNLTVLEEALNY